MELDQDSRIRKYAKNKLGYPEIAPKSNFIDSTGFQRRTCSGGF